MVVCALAKCARVPGRDMIDSLDLQVAALLVFEEFRESIALV